MAQQKTWKKVSDFAVLTEQTVSVDVRDLVRCHDVHEAAVKLLAVRPIDQGHVDGIRRSLRNKPEGGTMIVMIVHKMASTDLSEKEMSEFQQRYVFQHSHVFELMH